MSFFFPGKISIEGRLKLYLGPGPSHKKLKTIAEISANFELLEKIDKMDLSKIVSSKSLRSRYKGRL